MDSHGSCFGPFAASVKVGSGDGADLLRADCPSWPRGGGACRTRLVVASAALRAMAYHWKDHLFEGHNPGIISDNVHDMQERTLAMLSEVMRRVSDLGVAVQTRVEQNVVRPSSGDSGPSI